VARGLKEPQVHFWWRVHVLLVYGCISLGARVIFCAFVTKYVRLCLGVVLAREQVNNIGSTMWRQSWQFLAARHPPARILCVRSLCCAVLLHNYGSGVGTQHGRHPLPVPKVVFLIVFGFGCSFFWWILFYGCSYMMNHLCDRDRDLPSLVSVSGDYLTVLYSLLGDHQVP